MLLQFVITTEFHECGFVHLKFTCQILEKTVLLDFCLITILQLFNLIGGLLNRFFILVQCELLRLRVEFLLMSLVTDRLVHQTMPVNLFVAC